MNIWLCADSMTNTLSFTHLLLEKIIWNNEEQSDVCVLCLSVCASSQYLYANVCGVFMGHKHWQKVLSIVRIGQMKDHTDKTARARQHTITCTTTNARSLSKIHAYEQR